MHYPRMRRHHPNPVLFFLPTSYLDDGATKLNINKVFIGGLHFQTTQGKIFQVINSQWDFFNTVEDLIKYFSSFGEVESGSVVYNHENHKSRGFGFIIFKDTDSVKKVISFADHIIMGRRVEVKPALPKAIENSVDPSLLPSPTVGLLPGTADKITSTTTTTTSVTGTRMMTSAMSSSEQACECSLEERNVSSFSSSSSSPSASFHATPIPPLLPFSNPTRSSLSPPAPAPPPAPTITTATTSSTSTAYQSPHYSNSPSSSRRPFFSNTLHSPSAETADSSTINKHLSKSWSVVTTSPIDSPTTTDMPGLAPMENISACQSPFSDTGMMSFRYERPAGSEGLEEGVAEELNYGINNNVCFGEG